VHIIEPESGLLADGATGPGRLAEPTVIVDAVESVLREGLLENELWYKIRQEANTNPTLHDALEHAKMIYYLSRR
jgi:phosphopantothenoylcysteine synthetase/decarboxylase